MGKLLHERLMDTISEGNDSCAYHMIEGSIYCPSDKTCQECSDEYLQKVADEIERDYIPRAEHEAAVDAVVDAQKSSGSFSAHHIMKRYAKRQGMPFDEAQNITEWLDKWFIKRPLFEDGQPVQFGDMFDADGQAVERVLWYGATRNCLRIYCDSSNLFDLLPGERLKRPAPKVLDADGVEINVGDTVWFTTRNDAHLDWTVNEIVDGRVELVRDSGSYSLNNPPELLTHQKPVFDADGVRICVGDTVWWNEGYFNPYTVTAINYDSQLRGHVKILASDGGQEYGVHASKLTHKEPDSLLKLRDDILYADEQHGIPGAAAWADRITALMERGA